MSPGNIKIEEGTEETPIEAAMPVVPESVRNVVGKTKKIASVEFEETNLEAFFRTVKNSRMVQWVMDFSGGFVKDTKQANYVLLLIAVLIFSISAVIIIRTFSTEPIPAPEEFDMVATPQNL
ncbi:MAG: hypothetical protein AB200_02190 [Parcubacteria bacterium C7867-005]|nr:MAG: hypothetical protein AB200_02190 [Parcubacteria bacterium C7867-005]